MAFVATPVSKDCMEARTSNATLKGLVLAGGKGTRLRQDQRPPDPEGDVEPAKKAAGDRQRQRQIASSHHTQKKHERGADANGADDHSVEVRTLSHVNGAPEVAANQHLLGAAVGRAARFDR